MKDYVSNSSYWKVDSEHDGVVIVRANTPTSYTGLEIAAKTREALEHPLGYPALSLSTVPSDSVAISLEYGVGEVEQVLNGTLTALGLARIEQAAIQVLLAPEYLSDSPLTGRIIELVGSNTQVMIHNPEDEEHLALLSVTPEGLPVRLGRILCEADIVIPIGAAIPLAYPQAISGSFFPRFSDNAMSKRFSQPAAQQSKQQRQKLLDELAAFDALLGTGHVVLVVPGPGDKIADILCGPTGLVVNRARDRYQEIWSPALPNRAELVVARIAGDQTQQTWHNLVRAVAAADAIRTEDGMIAVCTELERPPFRGFKRLLDAPDLSAVERALQSEKHPDSAHALLLCQVLQQSTVYLQSKLAPELAESLGFAPVSSTEELNRLVKGARSCIVLDQAQYLQPKLLDPSL